MFFSINGHSQHSREFAIGIKYGKKGQCLSRSDELPNIAHLNEVVVRLADEEVGFNEITDYCYEQR